MDIIIATFVFIVIFIIFFGVLSNISETQTKKRLQEEGEMLAETVSSTSPVGFVKANRVDVQEVMNINTTNYSQLKTELDIRNDFCIYFEDENGTVISIRNETGQGIRSIGNQLAVINGVPCGE